MTGRRAVTAGAGLPGPRRLGFDRAAKLPTLAAMCAVGHLQSMGRVLDGLLDAAEETARATKRFVYVRRRKRGLMLRPGLDTPLWNELAREVTRRLVRRGDKAQLARILGVPRQRIHVLLVSKTAYPDAERTLRLLEWLVQEDRARGAGRPTASLPLPRVTRPPKAPARTTR